MTTNSPDDQPQSVDYQQATRATINDLRSIAEELSEDDVSMLSLPEVESMVERVAEVVPAGNVPGLILSGLARLRSSPQQQNVRRDIRMLFRGAEQVLDRAVYSAFFAGPAAVIWGYQNLLRMAGKDPDQAFPEGTWQFYVDYALREDTARHTNETHGFDTALQARDVQLQPVDRMTAWVMTAVQTLHQYDDLLRNEWRERVYTWTIDQVADDEDRFSGLHRDWLKKLPYRRGADARGRESYATYRQRKFDEFFINALNELDQDAKQDWLRRVNAAKEQALPAYQQQMSILAYLDPDQYGETRTPLPLEKIHVGIVYRGRYYLIPICEKGTTNALSVQRVRSLLAALLEEPASHPPAELLAMAKVQRAGWAQLRHDLPEKYVRQLDILRLCPIIINFDQRSPELPLGELRQCERGIGDHALTIFDTGETFCFDQSHIFFDGTWGAAIAEIMTNEALAWAWWLNQQSSPDVANERPYSPPLLLERADRDRILNAPQVLPETTAETDGIALKPMLQLRRMFKRRSDLLKLTVNDLLVLYRAIHALTYTPSPELVAELQQMTHDDWVADAAQRALDALQAPDRSPATLIPVDASQRSPRERLYPMTFQVPLDDLDLLNRHKLVMAALDTYEERVGSRDSAYQRFDQLQREYLASLAGFGAVMDKAKTIANEGESASVGTIKLLAHMPPSLQQLLDKIPGRFDLLNDIIKGREVFSNVGAVAPGSTLTRFITAKDDNEKKTLAWGVLTDAEGTMRVSLRDFRPHVRALIAKGQKSIATRLTEDYLDAYATGFNRYIDDLRRITQQSRETRMT